MLKTKARTAFLATIVSAGLLLPLQKSIASPAGDIVQAIKDAKIASVDDTTEVWFLSDHVMILSPAETQASEDVLRRRACAIARASMPACGSAVKQLTVLFSDKGNPARLRLFVLPGDVLKALSQSDDAVIASLKMGEGDRSLLQTTKVAEKPSIPGGASIAASEFSLERNKLAAKVQSLQAKGIGIKPYTDELTRIDALYGKADTDKAWGALNRLASTVREQEYKLQKPPASPAAISQARSQEANNVMAQFQGTNDAYYEQVKAAILARELGSDAPVDGPFQQERFRIAKRIQQLEGQGMRVDSYRSAYKQLEAIAATRDVKRISELKDRIRYLEQQLALPPLQGAAR